MGVRKLVRDCLTENNGESYCLFRVAGAALVSLGVPTFIGAVVYSVYSTQHFAMVEFGTAFCAMLSGMGVLAGGVALKQRSDT